MENYRVSEIMLNFVEIKEILSWTIFGQIFEELIENITGNSCHNFRKFSRKFYKLLRKL